MMDFSFNEEQLTWQKKAREFANTKIRPISMDGDQIEGGFGPWDWSVIEEGSKLGFRTQAVPKKWGGEGTGFVTQALVMMELAKGDSAICKAFSQNWKWSHLIVNACNDDQKERFLNPALYTPSLISEFSIKNLYTLIISRMCIFGRTCFPPNTVINLLSRA